MPKRVKLKGFLRRSLLQNIACFVPCAIFFCVLAKGSERGTRWMISVGAMGIVCCLATGFVLCFRQLRSVKCPVCGYVMRDPLPSEWWGRCSVPIVFYCPECEIKWHTGMRDGGN